MLNTFPVSKKIFFSAIMGSLLAFAIQPSFAFTLSGSDEEKGLAIAQESDSRNIGWNDSQTAMSMTLRNKQGDESRRELRLKSLEVQGDGDKSMTVFDSPKDVKGTGLMSYSHITKSDDQWLYLPALKRIKRISSRNKSGPFMGSEFAFEDLSSFEVEKYKYKYIGEEKANGLDAYKSEMIPVYKHSGYSKIVVWLDKKEFRIQKMDFYDRKKSLLKTQVFEDYRLYLDKYWRAHKNLMTNHQTGKSTILEFSEYKFQTGLKDVQFSKNALKRIR